MATLENTTAIIKLFTEHGMMYGHPGLSFTDIINKLGLPKSTASRLLSAMEKQQLLERNPDSKLYHVGSLILAVSSRYLSMPLIDMVAPYLIQLTKETTCTGYISILDKQRVKVMRVFPGSQFLQVVTPVGNVLSASETAIGRALLARKTNNEIREFYKNGYYVNSSSSPQTIDQLLAVLDIIRNKKWSFACNESLNGISSIATSIHNKHINEVIGLCLSAQSKRDGSLFSKKALDKLLMITHQLTKKLADDFLLSQ